MGDKTKTGLIYFVGIPASMALIASILYGLYKVAEANRRESVSQTIILTGGHECFRKEFTLGGLEIKSFYVKFGDRFVSSHEEHEKKGFYAEKLMKMDSNIPYSKVEELTNECKLKLSEQTGGAN